MINMLTFTAEQDPFKVHFENDLEEVIANKLQTPGAFQQHSEPVSFV